MTFSANLNRRQFLATLSAGSASLLLAGGCSRLAGTGDVTRLTLGEAAGLLHSRRLSPVDLVKACLDRIDRLNPKINAFITVLHDQALEQARVAEAEIAGGNWRGPLHGIPIGIKDNIDTAGIRTTAASAVFADRVPAMDAEVVTKLKAAGAIIIGKLNMHEFATGTTSAISHFGAVRNPWNTDHIAGGSSGGNAAAVASGLCLGSVGTDTGGSVRIPAACCGITGFKPTYGVVSTTGVVYISRSFDHVGPMCRTAEDNALMLSAMTEHPAAKDIAFAMNSDVSKLRVGVLRGEAPICDTPVEPEVNEAFMAAVEVIRSCVAGVSDAELSVPEHLGEIIDAEKFAFGANHIVEDAGFFRPGSAGSSQISTDKYDQLKRELSAHRVNIAGEFNDVDLVIVPTLPGLPLRIEDAKDPFALNACTFPFSIGGLPAISVPCGFSRSGLPVGLLIGGPPYADARVIALARAYQNKTDWHLQRPQLG
jgi:aspartyl-tRNA(Asn)/glutamyl-tRNA(Gln) amidotransferase subunit A